MTTVSSHPLQAKKERNLSPRTITSHFALSLKGWEVPVSGQFLIDTRIISCMYSHYKAHSLAFLAETLLKSAKKDVTPQQIGPLIPGTPDDVRTLAEYCLQDANLSRRVFEWFVEAELSKGVYMSSARAMATVDHGLSVG